MADTYLFIFRVVPMQSIPLARCVFLVPFANILNEIGAPTRSLLAKFLLPTQPEEKINHYMPLLPALRFVTTAQISQGVTDFGFHAGRRLNFRVLSIQFQASVRHSPTLLAALESWCRFVQLEDPFLQVWLERHEHSLRICTASTIAGAAGMLHLEHAQWLHNMMAIYIVREFVGAGWTPENFAFQARYCPAAESQSFWPGTRFLSGQNASWIDVPITLLALPNPARNCGRAESQGEFQQIDTDVITTLKLILSAYLDDHVPTIGEAAEIAGTSVRTLQRELSFAGLTFSRLLEHIRFEKAAEMLRETDAKIIDVAYATGYSDPAHFARAFRRIAGITPREHRNKWKERQPLGRRAGNGFYPSP
jgi:AraC-like DNA-binding protein